MVPDIRKQARTGDPVEDEPVEIPAGSKLLQGDVSVPQNALGLVIFAHGSGSTRHSPRNRAVARGLQEKWLATLQLDLLSPLEDEESSSRFDLGLMTPRLKAALAWAGTQSRTKGLSIGLFGASTGAAVALEAAAELGAEVRAVVSRGGRADLVGATLAQVKSPALLIVGSRDGIVLGLNRYAYDQIGGKDKELAIVPGASHLFEEEGALEKVTAHAASWFLKHLKKDV